MGRILGPGHDYNIDSVPARALAPSPARDVPRVDPLTADVERLARFLHDRAPAWNMDQEKWEPPNLKSEDYDWDRMPEGWKTEHRDMARAMVRDFDELEEILAEILQRGGRF